MALAVFDLDGTISRHDTLLGYVMGFLWRHPARWLRVLSVVPASLRFLLGRCDRGVLKAAFMTSALGGCTRAELDAWTAHYVSTLLKLGVFADALRTIAERREQHDVLVLMSASPDLYVPEIGRRLGFAETICTGVRWNGTVFDGALTTANRQGEEKARCFVALRARYPGIHTLAYANSSSDFAHLVLADEAWLVNPTAAMCREAERAHIHCVTWR